MSTCFSTWRSTSPEIGDKPLAGGFRQLAQRIEVLPIDLEDDLDANARL
jgi:hypothetical protein